MTQKRVLRERREKGGKKGRGEKEGKERGMGEEKEKGKRRGEEGSEGEGKLMCCCSSLADSQGEER